MILISDIARPLYRLEWTPQYFNADDWIACGKIIAVIWGFVLACVLIRNSLVWLLEKKIDLKEPIKVLGVTTVSIKLFEGVVGSLKVQVL